MLINLKAKEMTTSLKLEDRVEELSSHRLYITPKDYKGNFLDNPFTRLTNLGKPEIVRVK